MKLEGLNIGVAITGSFCTYDKLKIEIERLKEAGANVIAILSQSAQSIDTRFGKAEDFMEDIHSITGRQAVVSMEEVEPMGPANALDILIMAPCTGNTLAKLASGISDTTALMAAKGHLRNNKPLVISVSTNDALGLNFKNIGLLMSTKNIYFVPFGQDNYSAKPNSMIANTSLIADTLEAALVGEQLQPVILAPK